LAKPNYSFEKRQRELAKKKKKEEKAANKAAAKASGQPDDELSPNEAAAALARDANDDGPAGGDTPAADAPRA
jgi:hypothetical protein